MEGHTEYVVHVSDAECRVYKNWFMYTMSGRVFDVLYLGFPK